MQTEPRQNPLLAPVRKEGSVIAAHHSAMRSAAWPTPQFVGVNLVGSSVQNNGGILSSFTTSSYATMPFYWTSGALQVEAVVKFHWNGTNSTNSGIWGCVGSKDAFTPFYYETVNVDHMFGAYLSSNGTSWAINTSNGHWSIQNPPAGDYVLKLAWSEGTVKLYRWTGSAWVLDMTASIASIYGEANLVPQLGTNRGQSFPLNGTIDLNYTYLVRDGALLWEGVAGAFKNVARL